ncbi:uncharacterized protein SETTUDRAFT_162068 [Exserohilum turcica Et28A]|uniref:Uncharacterized protein n=1 Tax=Exserohilum turcicum (strain 28A) TaxID=671987 RepID=R0KQL5_EXST2|nr:uncharacterized protein SETTUDRAFT_162068 [Exserohilum turcica Et28A]EOA91309.1 hypothetical protein SETTUDRAFT_162068 [Exserohilum turcica Et28A]
MPSLATQARCIGAPAKPIHGLRLCTAISRRKRRKPSWSQHAVAASRPAPAEPPNLRTRVGSSNVQGLSKVLRPPPRLFATVTFAAVAKPHFAYEFGKIGPLPRYKAYPPRVRARHVPSLCAPAQGPVE